MYSIMCLTKSYEEIMLFFVKWLHNIRQTRIIGVYIQPHERAIFREAFVKAYITTQHVGPRYKQQIGISIICVYYTTNLLQAVDTHR